MPGWAAERVDVRRRRWPGRGGGAPARTAPGTLERPGGSAEALGAERGWGLRSRCSLPPRRCRERKAARRRGGGRRRHRTLGAARAARRRRDRRRALAPGARRSCRRPPLARLSRVLRTELPAVARGALCAVSAQGDDASGRDRRLPAARAPRRSWSMRPRRHGGSWSTRARSARRWCAPTTRGLGRSRHLRLAS